MIKMWDILLKNWLLKMFVSSWLFQHFSVENANGTHESLTIYKYIFHSYKISLWNSDNTESSLDYWNVKMRDRNRTALRLTGFIVSANPLVAKNRQTSNLFSSNTQDITIHCYGENSQLILIYPLTWTCIRADLEQPVARDEHWCSIGISHKNCQLILCSWSCQCRSYTGYTQSIGAGWEDPRNCVRHLESKVNC